MVTAYGRESERSDELLARDFRGDLSRATFTRSVQRVRLCLAVTAVFSATVIVGSIWLAWDAKTQAQLPRVESIVRCLIAAVAIGITLLIPLRRLRTANRDARVERRVVWMLAIYPFAMLPMLPELSTNTRTLAAMAGYAFVGTAVAPYVLTLCVHLFACAVLPLRAREAIVPILPLTFVVVVGIALLDPPAWRLNNIGFALMLALIATLPGALICTIREARFARGVVDRAVKDRYVELRGDLDAARRIHERLLPEPIDEPALQVDFVYEPMREIGGDLAYVHRSRDRAAFHVILLDVTGHGIAAALAVNRLHGELQRTFGTLDDPPPATILAALNDYLVLTTAQDAMFATAIAVRIDLGSGHLDYASAAHPDAMIRDANGAMRRLASTTCVLGACPKEIFDAEPAADALEVGETLVLFTDGFSEGARPDGVMLDLDGVERVLSEETDASPQALLKRLMQYRDGDPQDDCIILRVRRR